ncbi:hypothetical protein BJX63DRAFT_239492 [Aspergillus granulosus]|uniref:Uncharacterized protein n=1 Tax=Aspergillus granulosus TaxID=176169 RepID=A0ABR4HAR7_9EURO
MLYKPLLSDGPVGIKMPSQTVGWSLATHENKAGISDGGSFFVSEWRCCSAERNDEDCRHSERFGTGVSMSCVTSGTESIGHWNATPASLQEDSRILYRVSRDTLRCMARGPSCYQQLPVPCSPRVPFAVATSFTEPVDAGDGYILGQVLMVVS